MELKQRMDDMSISALVQTVEVAISNIHKVTEFLTKIKNTFLRLLREVAKNVTAAGRQFERQLTAAYSIGKEGEPTQGSVLGEIEALHSANTYIKAEKEEEYVETRSLETRIREMEHRNSRDPPKMKTSFFS